MSLSIADKIEISELVHKFCHLSDYCDYAGLKALYTDNPRHIIEGVGTYDDPDWSVEHARWSEKVTEGKNRHVVTNLWIEGDGDQADAHYFLINIFAGHRPMEPKLVTTFRARDGVVRTAQGWRIAERHLVPDQPFEMEGGGV
ncbi:hypothetical protein B9N43_05475 [Denitratisoma sp. DHT3]|uniref:nuclear transport factor 2 family protein n=1 Tax=Denitratisoma sp. DHT3 TaxID=1981880 RepID=UPI001198488B|nr:nuclear transport factor 2 family protein [Denitratisoma sp. DHT3]QDX80742.1 hypothetical protein B9N43_05475 [Denitratisoma sp. DHT3]